MQIGSGNIQNMTAEAEHSVVNGIPAKKVVIIDGSTGNPTSQTDGSQITDLLVLFHEFLKFITDPPNLDKSLNATRQTVVSGTVDTVTTVTTVTNLTNMGAWSASQLQFDQSQNTWANMCRSLIT